MTRIIILRRCTKLKFTDLAVSKIWRIFRLSIKRPIDRWPLTVWPVSRVMGLPPANFHLVMPFRSRHMVTHGTDGGTGSGRRCIMPTGTGHNVGLHLCRRDTACERRFRAVSAPDAGEQAGTARRRRGDVFGERESHAAPNTQPSTTSRWVSRRPARRQGVDDGGGTCRVDG